MEATASANNRQSPAMPTDAIIHVVGKKSLHSELLIDFIDRELTADCLFSPNGGLTDALGRFPGRTHLAFLDNNGNTRAAFFKLPELAEALRSSPCQFILFNVDPAAGIEMDALELGIRGILYTHQPLDFFPKAAQAVLNGELWYPRKVLAQFIERKNSSPLNLTEEACVVLTRREREVVTKLAEGWSNRKIARHFNISLHTVKTHAYNIYKKINVSNRLQASLWLDKQTGIEGQNGRHLAIG